MSEKRSVYIVVHGYPPAFRGGGPIQSVAGLVKALRGHYRFAIFTRSNDKGHILDVPRDAWLRRDGSAVLYATDDWRLLRRLICAARAHRPDVVYVNSFFHHLLSIAILLAWRLGLIPRRTELVIAPRGSFSPGALQIRHRKKWLFITLAKLLGLYRGIVWHATDEAEARLIRQHFGDGAVVRVSPNVPPALNGAPGERVEGGSAAERGPLRLVFLSRVSEKKNLLGAIEILKHVRVPVRYDVYGPVQDAADQRYWARCQAALEDLPAHIELRYRGPVPHHEVQGTLRDYDAFFLPTAGENFGHVFLEALAAGLPVVTSDQTPWRDLQERGLGWDVPLSDPRASAAALEELSALSDRDRHTMRTRCTGYARGVVASVRARVLESPPF